MTSPIPTAHVILRPFVLRTGEHPCRHFKFYHFSKQHVTREVRYSRGLLHVVRHNGNGVLGFQLFAKDDSKTVNQALAESGLKPVSFTRWILGN